MPGENDQPFVTVDADAIIALSNKDDTNHKRAKQILSYLLADHANVLFPTTAICEAVTVLRGRLNKHNEASEIVRRFQDGDIPIHAVDHEILKDAAGLYDPLASKKNTLFDAVVAATAKRLNADSIFSFDQWYRKIGLRLAGDIDQGRKEAV